MDIKEAIEHCREVAGGCPAGDRDCAYQHDQLGDWLEELMAYRAALSLARAQELAQVEKDGRLVVLPCKVGDKLWYIFDGMPYQSTVHGISVSPARELAIHFGGWPADVVWASNIGKTVFLTRQEVEKALREEAE